MSGRYGFSVEQWDEVKEEIKNILIDRAKVENTISYSELANQIMSIEIEPHERALHEMLGEISINEDDSGRGLLSALVIHKDGDMIPGQGFFDLAASRDRDTSDKDRFWSKELKSVFSYWKLKSQ
ncbi:MAG: hypothetical protein WD000_07260 [Thermodesulfobacteriota bacterium]